MTEFLNIILKAIRCTRPSTWIVLIYHVFTTIIILSLFLGASSGAMMIFDATTPITSILYIANVFFICLGLFFFTLWAFPKDHFNSLGKFLGFVRLHRWFLSREEKAGRFSTTSQAEEVRTQDKLDKPKQRGF